EIAQRDPDSGPQQGAARGVEEKAFGRNRNRTGEPGGERIRARQKLRQDQIPQPMRGETLLGVADEGVGVQGQPAQDPEHAGAVRAPQRVPEHVGYDGRGHRRDNRQRDVHPASAGQRASSDQHGDGRSRDSCLHDERPDKDDGQTVLQEKIGRRCHANIRFPSTAPIVSSRQAITSSVTASRTVSFTSSWRSQGARRLPNGQPHRHHDGEDALGAAASVDWISRARSTSTLVFNTVPPRPRIVCRITPMSPPESSTKRADVPGFISPCTSLTKSPLIPADVNVMAVPAPPTTAPIAAPTTGTPSTRPARNPTAEAPRRL